MTHPGSRRILLARIVLSAVWTVLVGVACWTVWNTRTPSFLGVFLPMGMFSYCIYRRSVAGTDVVLWLRRFHRGDMRFIATLLERMAATRFRVVALADSIVPVSGAAAQATVMKTRVFCLVRIALAMVFVLMSVVAFEWLDLGLLFLVAAVALIAWEVLQEDFKPVPRARVTFVFAIAIVVGIIMALAGSEPDYIPVYCMIGVPLMLSKSRAIYRDGLYSFGAAPGTASQAVTRELSKSERNSGMGITLLKADDTTWRTTVLIAIAHSRCIVVDISLLSEPLCWELARALERLPPRCIILCYCEDVGELGLKATLEQLSEALGDSVADCWRLIYPRGQPWSFRTSDRGKELAADLSRFIDEAMKASAKLQVDAATQYTVGAGQDP